MSAPPSKRSAAASLTCGDAAGRLSPPLPAAGRDGLGALALLPDQLISVIFFLLDLRSVATLASTSRLLRVFAAEEPWWLSYALDHYEGPVQYAGSWRHTALAMRLTQGRLGACVSPGGTAGFTAAASALTQPPPVPGFNSEFLWRRWFRRHMDPRTSLALLPGRGNGVECHDARTLSAAEFQARYDGPRAVPVVLEGALQGWDMEALQLHALVREHGPVLLSVSKPSGGRAVMALQDYVQYMAAQVGRPGVRQAKGTARW
jgi:hypothetical protein